MIFNILYLMNFKNNIIMFNNNNNNNNIKLPILLLIWNRIYKMYINIYMAYSSLLISSFSFFIFSNNIFQKKID